MICLLLMKGAADVRQHYVACSCCCKRRAIPRLWVAAIRQVTLHTAAVPSASAMDRGVTQLRRLSKHVRLEAQQVALADAAQ